MPGEPLAVALALLRGTLPPPLLLTAPEKGPGVRSISSSICPAPADADADAKALPSLGVRPRKTPRSLVALLRGLGEGDTFTNSE